MENWLDNVGVKKHQTVKKQTGQLLEVDLTPMLDVVMILLIFFIVTASFTREQTIEVELTKPSKAQADESQIRDIVFLVSATNEIWLLGRRIDVRSLRSNISRLHAENPRAKVIIKANDASAIERVVAIIDASRKEGLFNISLASGKSLKPKK